MADAELGLSNFDAAIEAASKSIDVGFRVFYSYLNLAAAHALKGDMDRAKAALAEARGFNPKLSVKWLMGRKPVLQPTFDALRKAGLPEELRESRYRRFRLARTCQRGRILVDRT
jgi:adenylate cyclase